MQLTDSLESALAYASGGLDVVANYTPQPDRDGLIPGEDGYQPTCDCYRHAECDSVGKHPRTDKGALDASCDPEITRRRFSIWPHANPGIATGRKVVVLDLDPRNGGDKSLQRATERHGPLPLTPTVRTGGGGRHYYFDPGDLVVANADLGLRGRGYPGLEVKSRGLQVIAPPSLHKSGCRYEWDPGRSLLDVPLAPIPDWLVELAGRQQALTNGSVVANGTEHVQLGQPALRFVSEGAPIGSQRQAAVGAARNYLSAGYDVEATIEVIWQGLERSTWDSDRGPWTLEHARRLVQSIATSPAPPLPPLRKAHANGLAHHEPTPPAVPPAHEDNHLAETDQEPPSRPLSEVWNAEQLVGLHGQNLKYCGESGWFRYRGGVWLEDRTGHVARLTKRMVKQWLRDAAKLEDEDKAKALAGWAIKCHTASKIENTIRLARNEARVAITINEFDRDPYAFNVANGTIDLRTGTLREHRAEDLLSKQSPVAFNPDALCPRWERFVSEILDEDAARVDYFQRLAGYSMTALQRHHLIVFLCGAGRNGKGTALETMGAICGNYSLAITPEVLLVNRENQDYHMATLRGARFVWSSESGQNRKLDEARVKRLSGGDTLAARLPYHVPFTFEPTHHLWLMTNNKPDVAEMTPAIWARIKVIEFPIRYLEPPDGVDPETWNPGPRIRRADLTLPEQLVAEKEGILAWMVRGAVAALRDGLREPASVSEATEHYRGQMDVLGDFLDECCNVDPYLSDSSARIYRAYKSWCTANGVDPVPSNKFGMLLEERGTFQKSKATTGSRERRWSGLAVKSDAADDEDRWTDR